MAELGYRRLNTTFVQAIRQWFIYSGSICSSGSATRWRHILNCVASVH